MTDLVEWLTQIWDEDEKRERAKRNWGLMAPRGIAYEDGRVLVHWTSGYEEDLTQEEFDRKYSDSDAQVLARIAADRKILRLHGGMAGGGAHECPDGFLDGAQTEPHTGWEVECETLRLMASAFADRQGYRDEWAV